MDKYINPWPIAFQHEKDQQAITDIFSSSFMSEIFDKLDEIQIDKTFRMVYSASCIKITDENSPSISKMMKEASELFELTEIPELYIVRDYQCSLEIVGLNHPFLVISSRFLELLCSKGENALYAALTSRIAGIQANHHRAALLFQCVMGGLQVVNIPKAVLTTLSTLLNQWNKCRYYTYDRVFFLVTNDIKMTREYLMINILPNEILNGMNLGQNETEYQSQLENFWKGTATEKVFNRINSMRFDAPLIPDRFKELDKLVVIYENTRKQI